MIGRRFRKLREENLSGNDNEKATILVDRDTGVNYLWIQSPTGSGLTLLVDKDGRPVVTKSGILKD